MNTIEFLSDEQNNILILSINKYVNYYLSDNLLPIYLKDKIRLNKFLDIEFNIKNSPILLDKIKNNEISIQSLPWLEPHLLDNNLWKVYIDKRDKNRDIKDKMATVNIFKCKKCGEKKCTTYQLQTASIDEPMTTYINCKVCGNSWKV